MSKMLERLTLIIVAINSAVYTKTVSPVDLLDPRPFPYPVLLYIVYPGISKRYLKTAYS